MVEPGVLLPWSSSICSWMFPALAKEGKTYTLNGEREIQETRYMIFSSFEKLSKEEKRYVFGRFFQLEGAVKKLEKVLRELTGD